MSNNRSLRGIVILLIIVLVSLAGVEIRSTAQVNTVELAVDTRNKDQDGLLVLHGGIARGGERGFPVGAGDINGDGRDDVIFCGMYANSFGTQNGHVNFYLSDGRDTGAVDAGQLPASIGFLRGATSGDLLGTSVATGDVNGDGIADVALGAFGDDGPGNSRTNSGAAYLVFGSPNFNMRASLATGTGLPPAGVTAIYGAQANGRSGIWVDIGDLDGDGFADTVVGTDQLSTQTERGSHRGGAFIIFGAANLPQVIDLASPPQGVRVTRILGVDNEDHWGSMLHINDINHDGVSDLAIAGAIFRDSASYIDPQNEEGGHDARAANLNGTRRGCGEVFVLYGNQNWPQTVDLNNPPANSTHVIGAHTDDLLGSQMHSADLNGDGRREFIVGALRALSPRRGRTGGVYVIYGAPELEGAVIDLSLAPPAGIRITEIYGEDHLDCAGDSVRSYDINGDGRAELFIGSPEHNLDVNGEHRYDAGDTKFIYGQDDFLPALIELHDLPQGLRVFRLAGAFGEEQSSDGDGDEMSYRLAGGDVDGDGFVDYIANAMHGNGFGEAAANAGNVFVFSGKKLSMRLGMLPPEQDPAPVLTSASLSLNGQTVEQAAAGQSGLIITITGTGFRADTQVLINGMIATAIIPSNPDLAATRRTVALDDNPSIRNTVGQLIIRVRNTNPASSLSNEVAAGRLAGPEIQNVRFKRKSGGALIIKVDGANLLAGSTLAVATVAGQPVTVKGVSVTGGNFAQGKIKASQVPAPGTQLRVQITSPTNILSNLFTVSVP